MASDSPPPKPQSKKPTPNGKAVSISVDVAACIRWFFFGVAAIILALRGSPTGAAMSIPKQAQAFCRAAVTANDQSPQARKLAIKAGASKKR